MGLLRHGYLTVSKFVIKIMSFFNELMYLIIVLYVLVLKVFNLRPLFYYYIFKAFIFIIFHMSRFWGFIFYVFYNNLYSMITNSIKIC